MSFNAKCSQADDDDDILMQITINQLEDAFRDDADIDADATSDRLLR